MARRLAEHSELLRMINDHMATLDDCHDMEAISLAHASDHPNGANWAISGFRHRGSGDQVRCIDAIEPFVTELQKQFKKGGVWNAVRRLAEPREG